MKSCWNLATFLILLDTCLIFAKKDYNGSSVLRVDIKNNTQLKQFQDLSKTFGYEVDEWGLSDIFVPNKNLLGVIETRLRQHGLTYKILIQDVGKLITEVDGKNQKYEEHVRRKRAVAGSLGGDTAPRSAKSTILPNHILGKYPTYKEITGWLHEAKIIAKPILQMFTLGQTYEKNDIYLLKIGLPSNLTKPALWFDFGVHSREWISVSTGMYTIYHLLEEYMQTKIETVQLLNKMDIYIMPVANPDGYIYSHDEDRMWRKNRTPDYGKSGCTGTDINRNFAYHWGEVRASCYPCDTQYRGPTALSELETQAIAYSVQALRNSLRAYVTVHSYSQMWLTRWGYTDDENDDFHREVDLASKAVQMIRNTTGKEYMVGSSSRLMYRFSGGAADWAKGSVGIRYAFGIELRDTGDYGFVLPVEQIDGTGREFLAALKVVGKHILEESKTEAYFYKTRNHRDEDCVNLENILKRKAPDQKAQTDETDETFESDQSDKIKQNQQSEPKISATRQKSVASSLNVDLWICLIVTYFACLTLSKD